MRYVIFLALVVAASGCAQEQQASPSPSPTSSIATETPSVSNSPFASSSPPASSSPSATGTFRIHYMNVGQGDGTIWEFPDGTMLIYDCGDTRSSPTTNPMTLYLRDNLSKPFGSTLWGLVASHGHQDHIGGCEEVFTSYQFQHVYDVWYQGTDRPNSYEAFKTQAKNEGAQLHVLLDDPALNADVVFHQWDTLPLPASAGVTVQILWPPSFQGNGWDNIADNSIVLRASHGDVDFCFQGDIETAQENVIRQYSQDLNCEVYLVGHHGSQYASGSTWLTKMDPEFSVVSFGPNSYGHPRSEALCRVQGAGSKVWATHRLGTITVTSDGATPTVTPGQFETTDYCAAGAAYWPSPSTTPTPTSTAPPASGPLQVTAYPSDPTPCRYSTVTIHVHVSDASGTASPAAGVSSAWHYKTTTSYESGATNAAGDAALSRSISSATAGYTVQVSVTANKDDASGSTSTSFTPVTC